MTPIGAVIFVMLVMLMSALVGATWYWAKATRLQQMLTQIKPEEFPKANPVGVDRYEVKVSDWGPDFDGENGNLHRWRWVVSNADKSQGPDVVGSALVLPYLMLGNAPTKIDAIEEALAWIEEDSTRGLPPVVFPKEVFRGGSEH